MLRQRELIRQKASDLSAVLKLIDEAIARHETTGEENDTMNASELFEVFPDMQQEYLDEAKEHWGSSSAWQQSAERMKNYGKSDLERMKAERHEIQARFEQVFSTGNAPDSSSTLETVEAARLHIQKWFYDCSLQFHVNLTAMTSMDERFVKNIDKNCAGLARFMHEAAKENLARG